LQSIFRSLAGAEGRNM